MKRLVIAVTLLAVLGAGCMTLAQHAAKAGKGKGGKPAAAAVETIDTTPEETWPPTTTIPFDPGTPITGQFTLLDGDLRWHGHLDVGYTYEGALSNRGSIFARVVCTQNGQAVFQGSDVGSYAGGVFPLVQQDGLAAVGILIDYTQPGHCVAELTYRILNDKDHSYQILESVPFEVAPA